MWYRTGTIAATNGDATITGTSTDFVSNVNPGDAVIHVDGRVLGEVASVTDATHLEMVENYTATTFSGAAYKIGPTQSFAHDLALLAAQLLNDFGDVRDGPGEGLWPDGSAASPAFRFSGDQDTGFYWISANVMGLSIGGTLRVTYAATGITQTVPLLLPDGSAASPAYSFSGDPDTGFYRRATNSIGWSTNGVERGYVDASGNMVLVAGLTVSGALAAGSGSIVNVGGQGAFTIQGASTNGALLSMKDANDEWQLYTTGGSNAGIRFWNGGDRLAITYDGKVGIGTTSPGTLLEVSAPAGTSASIITVRNISGYNAANVARIDFNIQNSFGGGEVVASIAAMNPNAAGNNGGALVFSTSANGTATTPSEAMRLDASGNLLVGDTTNSSWSDAHRIKSGVAANSSILNIDNGTASAARFFSILAEGWNTNVAAAWFGKQNANGRSINAGGTVNASGADYAEYMHKALGCGTILKGGVCGVDADGRITDKWADAVGGFVVKTTDPAYVGGDSWGTEEAVGKMPVKPAIELPEYDGPDAPEPLPEFAPEALEPIPLPVEPDDAAPEAPEEPVRGEKEDDVAWAQRVNAYVVQHTFWLQAVSAHEAMLAAHPAQVAEVEAANEAAAASRKKALAERATAEADHAKATSAHEAAMKKHAPLVAAAEKAHAKALAAFEAARPKWEAGLETARGTVDRISFCGQTPVIVDGAFKVGDYIVAEKDGKGIKAVAVPAAEVTFEQYQHRIGKVWGERDSKAWVDVQHG